MCLRLTPMLSTLIRGGSRGIELYLSKPGAPKKITKGGVVERNPYRNWAAVLRANAFNHHRENMEARLLQ